MGIDTLLERNLVVGVMTLLAIAVIVLYATNQGLHSDLLKQAKENAEFWQKNKTDTDKENAERLTAIQKRIEELVASGKDRKTKK